MASSCRRVHFDSGLLRESARVSAPEAVRRGGERGQETFLGCEGVHAGHGRGSATTIEHDSGDLGERCGAELEYGSQEGEQCAEVP